MKKDVKQLKENKYIFFLWENTDIDLFGRMVAKKHVFVPFQPKVGGKLK